MKQLTCIIFLFIFGHNNSQTSCSFDNLFGKWLHVTALNNKTNWTREKINNLLIDTTKDHNWMLSFDSSFVYNRKGRQKTSYIFNATSCKITYGNWSQSK